jgi:hypothetical protein
VLLDSFLERSLIGEADAQLCELLVAFVDCLAEPFYFSCQHTVLSKTIYYLFLEALLVGALQG